MAIEMIMTQYNGSILGPIAKILGMVMNFIFNILDKIGIPNVGLSIIIFTIFVYLCLMPLTIKQQKFSKLSSIMSPEIKQIQEKYKNKKDQDSMMAQNEEIQAVYKKYGVSSTGSCIQLVIQMPILFALYRVINNIPAYVTKIKETLMPLAEQILSTPGASEFLQSFDIVKQLKNSDFTTTDGIIDILSKATTDEWLSISEKFPSFDTFDVVYNTFTQYNNFLGLNIGDTPRYIIVDAFGDRNFLLVIGALMIPILAAVTQWLNFLFMPQQNNTADSDNPMMQSMKTMNYTMPLISAFFCFSFPCGMGIYWIAGAIVRSIQQVIINKYIDKMDLDAIVEKNKKKYEEQQKKQGLSKGNQIKKISDKANYSSNLSEKEKEEKIEKAKEFYATHSKPGSISEKLKMVDEYNKNNERK